MLLYTWMEDARYEQLAHSACGDYTDVRQDAPEHDGRGAFELPGLKMIEVIERGQH